MDRNGRHAGSRELNENVPENVSENVFIENSPENIITEDSAEEITSECVVEHNLENVNNGNIYSNVSSDVAKKNRQDDAENVVGFNLGEPSKSTNQEDTTHNSNEVNTSDMDTTDNETSEDKKKSLLKLPLARIKNIMKFDPDTQLITKEAAFLTTKATELFIEYLSKELCKTVDGNRKTVNMKDLDYVTNNVDNLFFLEATMDELK